MIIVEITFILALLVAFVSITRLFKRLYIDRSKKRCIATEKALNALKNHDRNEMILVLMAYHNDLSKDVKKLLIDEATNIILKENQ